MYLCVSMASCKVNTHTSWSIGVLHYTKIKNNSLTLVIIMANYDVQNVLHMCNILNSPQTWGDVDWGSLFEFEDEITKMVWPIKLSEHISKLISKGNLVQTKVTLVKMMTNEVTINLNGLSVLIKDIFVGIMGSVLIVDMSINTRILENTHIH